MNKNLILEMIISKLPLKRKQTPGNWLSYNCPHCMANGETRPDNRMRGGIKVLGDGAFVINCFNCKFKARYEPGQQISSRLKSYMKSLGFSVTEVKQAAFHAWKLQQLATPEERIVNNKKYFPMVFDEIPFPKGAKTLSQWSLTTPPNDFINILKYLETRGESVYNSYDYYWTPEPYSDGKTTFNDMHERLIIPMYFNDILVGFQARSIKDNALNRYVGKVPRNFMFNIDLLNTDRKIILLVEGVFDAIALGCLSSLGSSLTDEQINWLNMSGKDIVVLGDDDKAGGKLIDTALSQGWNVSYPWALTTDPRTCMTFDKTFDNKHIKDAADACKKYGRILTLEIILNNIYNNELQLNGFRKLR